jgi:hypothetical protein
MECPYKPKEQVVDAAAAAAAAPAECPVESAPAEAGMMLLCGQDFV